MIINGFFVSLIVAVAVRGCNGAVDIGKYLKICDRHSPDVNDCLVDAIQEGLDVLAEGIKELGVPAVDPYRQKELKVEYKNNQILVKMILKDILVHGLKASKVQDARLKADEDRFHLEVDMKTPRVQVTGRYHGTGRYNSLKLNATGEFSNNMTDLDYTWKLDGTPEKRDNETYIKINSFYMRPDVTDMKSFLSNDNPESRDLTNLGNTVVNENWRTLYRELLPFAQDNWNRIGVRVANKIFLKVPYDQLFPSKS